MLVMSKLCKHRSSNRAYEANITEDRFLNCTNGNFASTCCRVERTLTRNFLDIKLFLLLQILSTLCKLFVLSIWIYLRPSWSSKFFCKQLSNCINVNFATYVEKSSPKEFLDVTTLFYPPIINYANCTNHMNIPLKVTKV